MFTIRAIDSTGTVFQLNRNGCTPVGMIDPVIGRVPRPRSWKSHAGAEKQAAWMRKHGTWATVSVIDCTTRNEPES